MNARYSPLSSRAIGPRYPGVLSDDGLVALFTHPGDAQWTEVVPVEELEEAPKEPHRRRRWKQLGGTLRSVSHKSA